MDNYLHPANAYKQRIYDSTRPVLASSKSKESI